MRARLGLKVLDSYCITSVEKVWINWCDKQGFLVDPLLPRDSQSAALVAKEAEYAMQENQKALGHETWGMDCSLLLIPL